MAALMAECRKAPTQTPHARFSAALGCLRSHVYDFRLLDKGQWPEVIDRPARWNFAAIVGDALGGRIEAAARKLGARTQSSVTLDGIGGNLDIEWEDEVSDLKWVGEYAWREARKAPNEKHVGQVNAYAVAKKKPRWSIVYLPIHMLGKGENLEFIIWPGEADPKKAAADISARWALVEQHRAAGTLPEREVEEAVCRRLQCMHLRYCRDGGTEP